MSSPHSTPTKSQITMACDICFESFNEKVGSRRPMVLPCGHTVCESCIKRIFKRKGFKCPIDNKLHIFSSVEDIPINYKLISTFSNFLKEKEEKGPELKCSIHQKELLTFFCRTELRSICNKCLLAEGHMGHDLLEIDDYNSLNKLQDLLKNLESKAKNRIETFQASEAFFRKYIIKCQHDLFDLFKKNTDFFLTKLKEEKKKFHFLREKSLFFLLRIEELQERIFSLDDEQRKISDFITENNPKILEKFEEQFSLMPQTIIGEFHRNLDSALKNYINQTESNTIDIIKDITPSPYLQRIKLFEQSLVYENIQYFNKKMLKEKGRLVSLISKQWLEKWKKHTAFSSESNQNDLPPLCKANIDIIDETSTKMLLWGSGQNQSLSIAELKKAKNFWDDAVVLRRKKMKSNRDYSIISLELGRFFQKTYGGFWIQRKIEFSDGDHYIDLEKPLLKITFVNDFVIKSILLDQVKILSVFEMKFDYNMSFTGFKERVIECMRNDNNHVKKEYFEKFKIDIENITWSNIAIWKVSPKFNLERYLKEEGTSEMIYTVLWEEIYIPNIYFSRKIKDIALLQDCMFVVDIRVEGRSFHFKRGH